MAVDYPLFVLPGIMGSRLNFIDSGKRWNPDSNFDMWYYWYHFFSTDNRADLHFSEQPAVVEYDPDDDDDLSEVEKSRGWGGVAWKYYGSLLRDLQSHNPQSQVYAIGYDWRQSIRSLGIYTAQKITSVLQSTNHDTFGVVMHSMGGLVMRSLFITFPELLQKVKTAIFICPPAVGAPVMYRRLFTGAVDGLDGDTFADDVFRNIIGNTREFFLKNSSVLPGAMQLLPSGHYPAIGGSPWHNDLQTMTLDQLYTHATSPPGFAASNIGLPNLVVTDLATRATEVNTFHQHLGPPTANIPANSCLIYGTKRKTDISVRHIGNQVQHNQQAGGDGTVPQESALALAIDPGNISALPGLEHGAACNDSTVLQIVNHILG